MFDFYKEKATILSKLGSFYYKIINKDDKSAKVLSHLAFQTHIIDKLRVFVELLQGNKVLYDGYNKIIQLKDSDITCKLYTQEGIFVQELSPGASISPTSTGYIAKFSVKVPENMFIISLNVGEGQYLFRDVHFKSKFGEIEFTQNPITVVKNMRLFVRYFKYKRRNVMCYPLGLQNVYGNVSHIIDFYKNNQSLRAFRSAIYRSLDFPIVLQDAIIKQIVDDVYIDNLGNQYNCSYQHNKLSLGDVIRKDQVIVGEDIIKIYLPEDKIPNTLVKFYPFNFSVCGGDRLYMVNKKGNPYTDQWVYNPNVFFVGDGKESYINYVQSSDTAQANDVIKQKNIRFINSVEFLRDVIAPGRCLIIYINKNKLTEYTFNRLKDYIIDNLPIGAVVFFAESIDDIDSVNIEWTVDDIDLADPSDLYTQDQNGVELDSLGINTDEGLTVAIRVNWTEVSAAPLLWVSTQSGENYPNSVGTIGWKSNANHAGLFNTSGSSNNATNEFNAQGDSDKQVYIPDYISASLDQNAKNNSLKDKQLVYFITSKNGESRLYELTNDNSIQLLSVQNNMAQGIVKFLAVGHWDLQTPRQSGNATVSICKGVLDEIQMLKAASLLL